MKRIVNERQEYANIIRKSEIFCICKWLKGKKYAFMKWIKVKSRIKSRNYWKSLISILEIWIFITNSRSKLKISVLLFDFPFDFFKIKIYLLTLIPSLGSLPLLKTITTNLNENIIITERNRAQEKHKRQKLETVAIFYDSRFAFS